MTEVANLSVVELARWRSAGRTCTLLDVRTALEIEIAAISGALHIPMHEVPERIGEIPADRPVVVMCHRGGRSARIARFLVNNGHSQVFNLEGGIDAYSRFVDPTIPRY